MLHHGGLQNGPMISARTVAALQQQQQQGLRPQPPHPGHRIQVIAIQHLSAFHLLLVTLYFSSFSVVYYYNFIILHFGTF